VSVTFRRATRDDLDFLWELVNDEDVRPFLSVRTADEPDALLAEIERSEREPGAFGRFVIEVGGEAAGSMGFHVSNEPNRIARLERLAVHPRFRGRRIADDASRLFQRHLLRELGFHRLEMEIYGFNERAQAHARRVGWVEEGVKRRAYLRNGNWEDGVMYSLLRDDLEDE
jgi:RimJ/RimL family protein N-acetyltransferase